ncbi:MAG: ABC transporter transmembrane domain-containing protein [Comamonadaceae bacterium]|nr:ABC transporter transmembrane domain-containing protein [Comamonadaceae bacterium]
MAWVSNRVVLDLRNAMFAQLVRLPTRLSSTAASTGVLMSKIAYDVTGVTGAATSVHHGPGARTLWRCIGLLAWLLYLNWQLTLVALAIVPLVGLAVRCFSGRLRRVSRGRAAGDGRDHPRAGGGDRRAARW